MSFNGEIKLPPAAELTYRSLWLDQAMGREGGLAEAAPVTGPDDADIVIVGGGIAGLSVAVRLKDEDPSLDVAVVDAAYCGHGASGRSAGLVFSWWPKLGALAARYGYTAAADLVRMSERALDDFEDFLAAEDIDAHFKRGGWIRTAQTEEQRRQLVTSAERCAESGAKALEEAVGGNGVTEPAYALVDPRAATVQPALLTRGLRAAAVHRGVRLFERSRVVALTLQTAHARRGVVVATEGGEIRCDKTVITTGPWAAGIGTFARRILVVSGTVLATTRNPSLVTRLRCDRGEFHFDSQQLAEWHRATDDGRMLFGKAGVFPTIAYRGRIGQNFGGDQSAGGRAVTPSWRSVANLGPMAIDSHWSGPIDRSVSGIPMVGALNGDRRVLYAVGFSGNGLLSSAMVARTIAGLVLDRSDEWTSMPTVGMDSQRYPPEPIRYLGARIVRRAARSQDNSEARGEQPARLVKALASLTSSGVVERGRIASR